MGSKGSSGSAPQPAYQVPQPPSMSQNINEYIKAYPELFKLQQEYDPKLAEQQLSLLKEYGPQYDQYMSEQQQALTPYTYGLQEQLAQLASEGSTGAPNAQFQRAYLDQLRSEVGGNAGSGIGADYVSRGFNQQNEDYKRYYQNLGLSLLGRLPTNTTSVSTPQFQQAGGQYGFGDFANNQQQGYNTYVGGLSNQQFYGGKAPSSGGFNWQGALGGLSSLGGMFK